MPLRIHLTQDDLLRVSLAPGPALLTETVTSLRVLQQRRPGPALGPWQRWARHRIPRSAHALRALVPAGRAIPDFLTPHGHADLDEGLDALLHTPRTVLRADLEDFVQLSGARLPAWADDLASGSPRTLDAVARALRDWHEAVIAPMSGHLHGRIEGTRSTAARTLLAEGLDALLSGLHPTITWKPPVLELASAHHDFDIPLKGRGLHLVPSVFCGRGAALNLVDDQPAVVFYPAAPDPLWTPDHRPGPDALGALLGPTRAAVLRAVVAGHGLTTGELARRAGISAATVSHHTTLLRDAGLITTHRVGPHAHHVPTPLGTRLVDG
ncbi:helix-turn-helix transcriptional regulator [Streptomyces roseirectus]|uniref:Helix-turn-helix transcriptional regulator n=1 Tax=Streptomyces roseirectus TaxID=2768066 RepID=A0A7H0IQW9_9ACTN|nr:helix-turn-helix domain-containing protein [Streptomyces roseirectus]QNP75185.1 helix-turn-helix transcriptional regulator [Streptomyces roseirectus]